MESRLNKKVKDDYDYHHFSNSDFDVAVNYPTFLLNFINYFQNIFTHSVIMEESDIRRRSTRTDVKMDHVAFETEVGRREGTKIFGLDGKIFFIGLSLLSLLVCVAIISFTMDTSPESTAGHSFKSSSISNRKFAMSNLDPNSFSNPDEVHAESYHFEWDVNFEGRTISGSVLHNLVAENETVKEIIFDTRSDLQIKSVKDSETGELLNFEFGPSYLTFGKPLVVSLPQFKTDSAGLLRATIIIEYETTPKASGLQWLTPEQTGGKVYPFLFSQNQAINARSMFPCQDTSYTKATFTANVRVAKPLIVLMGGVSSGPPEPCDRDKTKMIHKWSQPQPIPSYLVAIAVGQLGYRDLGQMSRIWAEPMFLEDAASDFEDTEKMLAAASSLAGKYVWGRYDLLLLPPSFPYGGMENPCLTFLTPSIITGDKSLTNVIAHEIAHSWSGNLVTNKNFEHFWLNEGFTVFLERKILGILQGEQERQFASLGGLLNLKQEIVVNLKENNPLTQLVTNLTNIDADDAFSIVPYEKGSLFLYYLETQIGGEAFMNEFLKAYFANFAKKSIDTTDWKRFFLKYLADRGKSDLVSGVDWDTWLHKPGMPIVVPNYDRTLYDECVELRDRWVNWDPSSTKPADIPFSGGDIQNFTSGQLEVFLQLVIDSDQPINILKLQEMERLYNFDATRNVEILFRWIRSGLKEKVKWETQVPKGLALVTKYGRMKYLRPIYQDLYRWGGSVRQDAIDTFKKNVPNMMDVAVNVLKKDLHLDS